jgi:endoglucanase
VDQLVDHAARRGITIVLDLHDYGFTASGNLIGRDQRATQEFAEQWSSLALHYRDEGNIIFGLMNEPHEQTPQEWLAGVNTAIAAIRAVGARQRILVPGTAWDGGWRWRESGNAAALTGVRDPAGNYAFEVHQYLDASGGGDAPSVVKGSGSQRLVEVTEWARRNGDRLFLGEFGFASDPESMHEGTALVDYVHANPDVWDGMTFWAAGPGWGDYFFSAQPDGINGAEKPQMAVLTRYLCSRSGSVGGSSEQ